MLKLDSDDVSVTYPSARHDRVKPLPVNTPRDLSFNQAAPAPLDFTTYGATLQSTADSRHPVASQPTDPFSLNNRQMALHSRPVDSVQPPQSAWFDPNSFASPYPIFQYQTPAPAHRGSDFSSIQYTPFRQTVLPPCDISAASGLFRTGFEHATAFQQAGARGYDSAAHSLVGLMSRDDEMMSFGANAAASQRFMPPSLMPVRSLDNVYNTVDPMLFAGHSRNQ